MNRTGADLPVLIGQAGPLNGQRWMIRQSLVLGREETCDIVIPDRQISRFHARLTLDEQGVLLEDLASKNGTYCNGKPVSDPIYIKDGDVLQVALVQSFVFLDSDATMPMESSLRQASGGRLTLDERSRRVWIKQREITPPLSAPQFRFLKLLYQNQGRVVPRQELIMAVWEDKEAVGISDQALDALARRLRERLAEADPTHAYIVTVRGHGIRLDNPAE